MAILVFVLPVLILALLGLAALAWGVDSRTTRPIPADASEGSPPDPGPRPAGSFIQLDLFQGRRAARRRHLCPSSCPVGSRTGRMTRPTGVAPGIVRGHADRHARLGPRRRLLPDLPGPVRAQRTRWRRPARSSRGTRRRPIARVQGRRPVRRRRAARRARRARGHRALPDPDLQRRPRTTATTPTTTSQVDPLLGGDAALRELLDAAHARGMRVILDGVFNHCGRGLLAVPPRARERGGVAVPRLVPSRSGRPRRARPSLNAYPDRGGAGGSAPLGYRAWWGLPALPKLNIQQPADARVPARRRRALAPVRHRRLAARRPGRDRRPGVLAGVPPALPGDRPARRTSSASSGTRRPTGSRATGSTPLMNYPLGTAILGFAGGGPPRPWRSSERHDSYRRMLHPLDGPAFGRRLEALMTNYDPDVVAVQLNLIGSHDTPRALTVARRRPRRRSAWRCCSSRRLPGAPCIYYGDEIGMEGDHDPDNRRAYPADPTAGDRDLRAFVRRPGRSAGASTSPCAAATVRRPVGSRRRRSPSCARRTAEPAIVAINAGPGAGRRWRSRARTRRAPTGPSSCRASPSRLATGRASVDAAAAERARRVEA